MPSARRAPILSVVSSDDLATMSDNELQYRHDRLWTELSRGGPYDRQRSIEMELAYCQREIDIRMKTYALHAEYLSSLAAQDPEEHITAEA